MAKVKRPFHLRSVFELGSDAWGDDRFWNPTWIKFRETVSLPGVIDDPEEAAFRLQALSRCLIAYASDMGLVGTAVLPHQSGTSQVICKWPVSITVCGFTVAQRWISGCCFTSARLQPKGLEAWCIQNSSVKTALWWRR